MERDGGDSNLGAHELLDLVVADKHHSATSATEDVGTGALEEGRHTLLLGDLDEAINGAVVEPLLGARLHHEATANSVEGVRGDTRGGDDNLGDDELEDHVGGLEDADGRVVEAEVGATVHDDARNRDTETLVEREGATLLGSLGDAVNETVELTLAGLADVSAEAGTGEVEGVHDEEGGGAGKTAGSHVDTEPLPELLLLVVPGELRTRGHATSAIGTLDLRRFHGRHGKVRAGERFVIYSGDVHVFGTGSHDGLEEILEGEVERLGGCRAQDGKRFQ